MIADWSHHVERHCSCDSFHSSHSQRSETGRVGECRPAPATGHVQTQRSAAKIEHPGSISEKRIWQSHPLQSLIESRLICPDLDRFHPLLIRFATLPNYLVWQALILSPVIRQY